MANTKVTKVATHKAIMLPVMLVNAIEAKIAASKNVDQTVTDYVKMSAARSAGFDVTTLPKPKRGKVSPVTGDDAIAAMMLAGDTAGALAAIQKNANIRRERAAKASKRNSTVKSNKLTETAAA